MDATDVPRDAWTDGDCTRVYTAEDFPGGLHFTPGYPLPPESWQWEEEESGPSKKRLTFHERGVIRKVRDAKKLKNDAISLALGWTASRLACMLAGSSGCEGEDKERLYAFLGIKEGA